jgi:hypothetical protein
VSEPIYRWECTLCDAGGVAESSEMARLNVNTHLAMAHPGDRSRPASDAADAAGGRPRRVGETTG